MIEGLLLIFLKKAAAKLGADAAQLIMEALLGKPTSLKDIQELMNALQSSINMLPAEITKRINDQKYFETISSAQHNTKNKNYKDLLIFLDDGDKDKSYWGVSNSLCIDMYRVSAFEMEENHNHPQKIKFRNRRDGYAQKYNEEYLKEPRLITDYMTALTGFTISLGTAIVTITHVATEALKVIAKCPPSNPHYNDCQRRINNSVTKRYLPMTQDRSAAGGKGLPYILAPAIAQAPRAIAGYTLASIYEGAVGSDPISAAIKSARFVKDKVKEAYLPSNHEKNPYLEKNPTSWSFKFSDKAYNWVTISHGSQILYIGYSRFQPQESELGVRTSSKPSSWNWYIYKSSTFGIVFRFRNGTASSPYKNVLSTTKIIFKTPFAAPGSFNHHNGNWYLE